jgi:hypothetical protein
MNRTERKCIEPAKCRSCGELILWVEWSSGKKMPANVTAQTLLGEDDRDSDFLVVDYRPSENKLLAHKYDAKKHRGRNLYRSHFATCPNAKEHRKP